MKKFVKLNLLAAGIFLAFNSAEAAKIYDAKNLITGKNMQITAGEIRGEGVDIFYKFEKNMLVLKIYNTSDELVNINWNDAKYIGLDGKESRAYDFKQKERGWFESLTPAGIRPNDYYEAFLVPSSNLKSVPSTGVTGGIIYIGNDLFDPKSPEIKNRKRDYAELVIPVTVGKPYSGKSSDIIIYLGDKENVPIKVIPNAHEKFQKNGEVKSLAPVSNIPVERAIPIQISAETASKLKNAEEENSKLQGEIRAREQLLKYLQEQELLKKQLAETEAEIQKLLKSTNP